RAFWWHAYDRDDLIVASAPDENLHIAPGETALLPVDRLRVDRFGTYTGRALKPPPSGHVVLPQIVRARFRSFSLTVPSNRRLLLSTMAARRRPGAFRVMWSRGGLNITLDMREFATLVAQTEKGSLNVT